MGKRITIRSSKSKGMRLQKWVAEKICYIFDLPFDNQNDNSLVQSRTCGLNGKDIVLRGEVYNKFPYDIECKNTEKLNLYDAIEQAKQNQEANREWMVVHKKNQSDPIVIISWEAFEKLFRKGLY